jgi:subtilisin family serine protease
MKSNLFFLTLSLLILVLAGCTKNEDLLNVQDNSPEMKSAGLSTEKIILNGKYIVVLKNDAEIAIQDVKIKNDHVKAKAYGLLKKYEITGDLEEVYETALQGFAMKMSPGQAAKMLEDSTVLRVEADQVVTISGKKPVKPAPTPTTTTTTTPTTTTQNTPWGITRVGGGGTYTGTGVAWVIDSGIDLTHPDLNVSTTLGISYVSGVSSPNDDNGHGTHVAGIIAAKNNTIGVVGVAPGALLIPVKVLDSTGSGTFSGVLAGINYVAANGVPGDVANMSLGGGISPTIDDAVFAASAKVKFAIAAGNETDNALNHSPARAEGPNIYTVSAMASGDTWASFSNYGTPVDCCAPGVSVYSTYKGGGYVSMSGTSMAAPHVAGLLLLGNIGTDLFVKNDPDGVADPIAHKL